MPKQHISAQLAEYLRRMNLLELDDIVLLQNFDLVFKINITPRLIASCIRQLINLIEMAGLGNHFYKNFGKNWQDLLQGAVILEISRIFYYAQEAKVGNPLIWENYLKLYRSVKHIRIVQIIFQLVSCDKGGFKIGPFGWLRIHIYLEGYTELKTEFPWLEKYEKRDTPMINYQFCGILEHISQKIPKFDYNLITSKVDGHTQICIGDLIRTTVGNDIQTAPQLLANTIKTNYSQLERIISEKLLDYESINPDSRIKDVPDNHVQYWVLCSDGVTLMTACLNYILNTEIVNDPNFSNPISFGIAANMYQSNPDTELSVQYFNVVMDLMFGIDTQLPSVGTDWKGNPGNNGGPTEPKSPRKPKGGGGNTSKPNSDAPSAPPESKVNPDSSIDVQPYTDTTEPSAPPEIAPKRNLALRMLDMGTELFDQLPPQARDGAVEFAKIAFNAGAAGISGRVAGNILNVPNFRRQQRLLR